MRCMEDLLQQLEAGQFDYQPTEPQTLGDLLDKVYNREREEFPEDLE